MVIVVVELFEPGQVVQAPGTDVVVSDKPIGYKWDNARVFAIISLVLLARVLTSVTN